MLNRRIIIIVVVGIAIVIIATAVYFKLSGSSQILGGSNQGPASGQSLTVPVVQPDIPPGDTITLGTPKGSVTVNNFYKTAAGQEENTIILAQDPSYVITYDKVGGAFTIALAGSFSSDVQGTAEAKFLQILGAPQAQVCNLSISEIVGGRSYTPAFCASGH